MKSYGNLVEVSTIYNHEEAYRKNENIVKKDNNLH